MCLMKCLVFVVVVINFVSAQEDVETGDNLKYQFFPVTGDQLHFKVRAGNDAHIAISQHPQETDPMYEVVIGGWGNSKSVIRRRVCSQPEKDGRQTPQYLNNEDFRSFWVKWDMGVITVGHEGEKTPFLSWRDPDPFSIGYVGFHTGFGSSGVWKIKNISTTDKKRAYEEYELKTGDNVKYEFFSISENTVLFKVRASNDVHVALTAHPWESGPMYEIVIGGWANSKSVIRRRYCELPERDAAQTSQYLDDEEFRGFWARWTNGIILVGRDGETGPFMAWHDPEPFKVSFAGVHTGYGSTGTWKINNVPVEPDFIAGNIITDAETGDNLQYQFFPVTGDLLHFKVRARNDAHIAFSQHPKETDPMYEVVIGGWGNSKSVIRRRVCSQPEKDGRQTPQYLDNEDFRSFWVKWDVGIITVGREGEKTPFLLWRDPDPFSIGYVGFHTGFGSGGVWKIKNVSTTDKKRAYEEYELKTGDNVKYEFFSISENTVLFKVRASNDVHVALTPHPWESGPMYEIVIGGWANSKSVIRRRYCELPERDAAQTSQYLDDEEFRGFWARWTNGIILVGRDGETGPFMAWHDPEPFKVSFVGVHTGYGSTGTWKIHNVPHEPNNVITGKYSYTINEGIK